MSNLKLNLTIPELKEIEINGNTFKVSRSSTDILNKSNDISKKYNVEKFEKNEKGIILLNESNIQLLLTGTNEIIAYLNTHTTKVA